MRRSLLPGSRPVRASGDDRAPRMNTDSHGHETVLIRMNASLSSSGLPASPRFRRRQSATDEHGFTRARDRVDPYECVALFFRAPGQSALQATTERHG